MANKARHNSALLAFTDIYKLPLAEAYAARQRHKINLNAAQNIVLWFEPLPENHPRSIAEGATLAELVSTSSISFDYEHLTSTKWKIHLDIGLHILPIARIAVRSSFFVDGNDTDVFSMATLLPMYELAFKNMTERFKEKCDEHTIEFNRRIKNTINEKEMFVNGIIDSYFNFRKRDEVLNQKLLAQSFLELSPGINTLIVVNWVFIILDEVLFFNDAFDHEHNQRELATESIPQPIYHTIKHKFIELEKGNIKFNLFDSILFYLCLDIALQLIIGDNSDALLPALIEKGFTDDKQQKFIETGNDMFRNLQQTLVNSGSTISNLEERKDWNEIIK